MQTRVYYDDTDAGGIVYHTNYLKYCERARSDMFFKVGLSPIINDAHFVVKKIECDFIKSAKFADILYVSTKLVEIKKASFVLEQIIYLDQSMIFTAKILLTLVKDGKIKRLDIKTKQLLEKLFDDKK